MSTETTHSRASPLPHLELRLLRAFAVELARLVNAGRSQLDRQVQRVFTGVVGGHMPILDKSTVLQERQDTGNLLPAAVVIQHLLAQTVRVGVQQAGEDFFFKVSIDVHAYLFTGNDRVSVSLWMLQGAGCFGAPGMFESSPLLTFGSLLMPGPILPLPTAAGAWRWVSLPLVRGSAPAPLSMIAPPLVSRPVPIESWDSWVAGLGGLPTGSVLPVEEVAAKALSDAADSRPVRARAANLEFFMGCLHMINVLTLYWSAPAGGSCLDGDERS